MTSVSEKFMGKTINQLYKYSLYITLLLLCINHHFLAMNYDEYGDDCNPSVTFHAISWPYQTAERISLVKKNRAIASALCIIPKDDPEDFSSSKAHLKPILSEVMYDPKSGNSARFIIEIISYLYKKEQVIMSKHTYNTMLAIAGTFKSFIEGYRIPSSNDFIVTLNLKQ